MFNRKIVIFIIVLISLIKKIQNIQDRQVLLRLKDKSISTILHTLVSLPLLVYSLVELTFGDFNEGMSTLNTCIMGITLALGGNSRYCICGDGVILDDTLYKWNDIKSWRFKDSLMNEVLIELDDKDIEFVVDEEYNEDIEKLLNKYIA
ncbi:hypothetical protein [Tepidibacter hydrothermalis]|uniref:DUF5673 domain-containing protein n=1 Tax=Tepidibacter hydrothermalis TaxID=3036126 RepID=A0ABY8E915_9FIRM|nr:hypothetical protein [Tepidibacter hydrothermalis]WFD09401.1 hypothetical protein P4S50_13525 [Tepidibacter hydrothermalis]